MQPLKNTEEAIRARVAELERRDSALAREMKSVRAKRRRGADERVEEMAGFLESAGRESAQPPSQPPQELALETIVLRTGRPVLSVVDDGVELVFTEVESEVWRSRLEPVAAMLHDAVRAVGRVEVSGHPFFEWIGTGWLVAPDVVVTNRHVAAEFGRRRGSGFSFKMGMGRRMAASIDFREEIGRATSAEFDVLDILHVEDDDGADVALLKVKGTSGDLSLASPLALATTAAAPDQQVAVIGYPARDSRIPEPDLMTRIFGDVYDKKRFAPGLVTAGSGGTVQHDCSTLGGNSGSVVLDLKTGEAVALHFAGRFLEANFAVAANVIADRLRGVEGRPTSGARVAVPAMPRVTPHGPTVRAAAVTTTPATARGGRSVTWTLPLRVTVDLGAPTAAGGAVTVSPAAGDDREEEGFDDQLEATPADYADRGGYDPAFLNDSLEVPLPQVTRAAADILHFDDNGEDGTVLKYEHFSVVMSRSRRMCFLSAVNIDGKRSRKGKRPGWRLDPRIPREAQIRNECYGNQPKFARGHMTRREDPIWGSETDAARGNADSMHVTNTTPQMQPFNAGIWLGLEDYALDHAREDDMRICVFTGPFLQSNDPVRFGVMIPRSFWKVIAFVHDETAELCATGYTMSQDAFLREDEFVFGQHTTAQASIASIEARAGVDFGPLAAIDPFGTVTEALEAPLLDFSQIVFRR